MIERGDQFGCPVATVGQSEHVTLSHGEGGRLSRRLVQERIVAALGNPLLYPLGDAAALPATNGPLVFTTDSFVVSPLFFPGGDIGTLAVFGTVNDLAVAGAVPKWLSLSLILEEGLPLAILDRVIQSIARAAREADVLIVTGDTKVVPRGAADGMFLTTSGIGELVTPAPPGPAALVPGDVLLVSGPIGRHGIAVLAARDEFGFQPPPESDCGSLLGVVEALRQAGVAVRAMRDATRGGVAAVLHEWAQSSGRTLTVDESQVPVSPEIRGACELLGLDPLHIANEGTMLLAVPPADVNAALAAMHTLPKSVAGAVVGAVGQKDIAPVVVRRMFGSLQPLDEPLGSPLPRIC